MALRIDYNGCDMWKRKATELLNQGGGGGTQIQSDWAQTDASEVDYIKNKPTIPAAQIQSDWAQSDNSSVDFIKNKPSVYTQTEIDNLLTNKQNKVAVDGSIAGMTIGAHDIIGTHLKMQDYWYDSQAHYGHDAYLVVGRRSSEQEIEQVEQTEITIEGIESVFYESNEGGTYLSRVKIINSPASVTGIVAELTQTGQTDHTIKMTVQDGFMSSDFTAEKAVVPNSNKSLQTLDYIGMRHAIYGSPVNNKYYGEIELSGNYAAAGATQPKMWLNPNGIKLTFDIDDGQGGSILINKESISNFELYCLDGVTGNIQTQLNGKQTTITGGATTIVSSDLTASRALVSNSSGKVAVSSVTSTELGYLSGVTSAIQTQIDGKQATITGGATTIVSSDLTKSRALVSNSSGKVAVSSVTSTELGYLSGVTSAIQTQLNAKAATTDLASYLPLAGGSMTGGIVTKTSSFDLTTAPASSTRYTNSHVWYDKAGNTIARIRGSQNTSNGYYFNFETRRVISDTTYSNNLSFGIASDGTYTVSVNRAAAWRTGLGLGSVATLSTVPIANGGTGATSRLAALKALTNENVGTNATYFLTITDSWGKGGYTTVANARSVLGVSNLVIARKKAYDVGQVGHRTAIAADTISGYKFLCWVHCSTNGWVGNCYVQDPVASSTYVWNATYSQTLSGSVYVTALYIRDI